MKCEFCKVKLSPYLLKNAEEIEGKTIFELECYNCRRYNYITPELYYRLKLDWEFPKIKPLNNKLPSQMNVIYDSLQRCGISWVHRVINQVHEVMFKEPLPPLNAEVSKLVATRDRFPIIPGWSNVYEADPKQLLDRDYDRVIVIERDLETLWNVHQLYFEDDFAWQQRETYKRKLTQAWDLVYSTDYSHDPRYIKIQLEDLNNHTVDTFNQLLDFLNFPSEGRPPIVPVAPPDRNWETFSSILKRGHKPAERLLHLDRVYRTHLYMQDPTGSDSTPQNILIIGERGAGLGCHFSEGLFDAFESLIANREIFHLDFFSPEEIIPVPNDVRKYAILKELYPLSEILKRIDWRPDLIIISECAIHFENNTQVPVFYIQNEMFRPLGCYYPTLIYFWTPAVLRYFDHILFQNAMSKIPHKKVLPPAFNPDFHKPPDHKIYTVGGIGYRSGEQDSWKRTAEIPMGASFKYITEIVEKAKKETNISYWNNPVSDALYRETLPLLTGLWIPMPPFQWISRRMLEALGCKTAPIFEIESQEHREFLESLGFIEGTHYIGIKSLQDLATLYHEVPVMKKVADQGYQLVLERHTYKNRVRQILEDYKEIFHHEK